MIKRATPTAARCHELFVYDPQTGILRNRCNRARAKAGDEAGSVWNRNGVPTYRRVSIDGAVYRVHPIIWLMQTGALPADIVDHRNGDGLDNRWSNLREATQQNNVYNSRKRVAGLKGVCFRPNRSGPRYFATIGVAKQKIHLGTFDTEEEAHAAYVAAARKYHGEFARVE